VGGVGISVDDNNMFDAQLSSDLGRTLQAHCMCDYYFCSRVFQLESDFFLGIQMVNRSRDVLIEARRPDSHEVVDVVRAHNANDVAHRQSLEPTQHMRKGKTVSVQLTVGVRQFVTAVDEGCIVLWVRGDAGQHESRQGHTGVGMCVWICVYEFGNVKNGLHYHAIGTNVRRLSCCRVSIAEVKR
jgi:hypothetical protein